MSTRSPAFSSTAPLCPLLRSVVVSPPILGSTPTGARARLLPHQLTIAGTHTISICNPPIGQTTCTPDSTGGPFNAQRHCRAARADFHCAQQPAANYGRCSFGWCARPLTADSLDRRTSHLVSAQFNGTPIAVSQPSSRQLGLTMPALPTAGLFPISVTNNLASPSSAVASLAVFPDYGASNPPSASALLPLTGAATPSAIAIDDVFGVAAVAEAGTNKVEFINLNGGNPVLIPSPVPVGTTPTGVAVDTVGVTVGGVPGVHVTAVVNYADRTVELLRTPAPGGPVNPRARSPPSILLHSFRHRRRRLHRLRRRFHIRSASIRLRTLLSSRIPTPTSDSSPTSIRAMQRTLRNACSRASTRLA